MLISSLFLSWCYKLVGWLVGWYRVLLHFCCVFHFSLYYVKPLRYTFFPPSQYRIESLVATQDNVSWYTFEDETWETEHWTAIKEPPTLARTLRHLRYLWSCYWREARVITMRVYNPFLAVRLHHSFVSFYPFLQNLFLPSRILSLSLSLSLSLVSSFSSFSSSSLSSLSLSPCFLCGYLL